MLNLILFLLILNALLAKRNVLYCGLFGWVGISPELFNFTKIKVLGGYNDERGGDGFGAYIVETLFKSIDPTKFVTGIRGTSGIRTVVPQKHPVYIGHTRKKSTGKIDLEHTQPIQFLSKGEKFKTCVAHNGTINNLQELIESLGYKDRKEIGVLTDMSDSQVITTLLHLCKKDKRPLSEVLSRYHGTAAMLFNFSSEPNAVYVWKGESRTYREGPMTEDRPLFFLRDETGFFFSSIEDPLSIIRSDEFSPERVPSNTLLRFEGTKMVEVEKVDRSMAFYTFKNTTNSRSNFYRDDDSDSCGYWDGFNEDYPISMHSNAPVQRSMGFKEVGDNVRIMAPTQSSRLPNGLLSSPTKAYLLASYSNFYKLWTAFNHNAVLALDYSSKLYSVRSIFNSAGRVPVGERGRIFYYKGRYVHVYTVNKVPTYIPATGIFLLDKFGFYSMNREDSSASIYSFICGVQVNKEAFLRLHGMLKKSANDWTDNCVTTFASDFSVEVQFAAFVAEAAEPIAGFFKGNGELYTMDSNDKVVLFDGKFIPSFSEYVYTVDKGIVSSLSLISPITPKSNLPVTIGPEEKEKPITAKLVYNIYKELENVKPDEKIVCVECEGEDKECILCKGEGLISYESAKDYMEAFEEMDEEMEGAILRDHVVRAKEEEKEEDTEEEDLSWITVGEILKNISKLSKEIEKVRNEITELGVSNKLTTKALAELDNMDRTLAKITGYNE